MHLGFQAHAGHAQRLAHPFLVIDDVFLGQDVQGALIGRDRHGLRRIDYPLHIVGQDFAVADGDDAVGS